ncbi:MAG: peptide-methionine (R)-S-oxide reductase MsrB [Acidimicrobiia bacterium]
MAETDKVDREIAKTDEEWRSELTPEQYQVLRKAGTEPAFTGRYWDCHDDGMYRCAACGAELFDAGTKFESGTGWPSFTEPAVADAVEVKRDLSHGMMRTEAVCRRCGGHLGHVFDDGPGPSGQRWCINSCSIELDPRDDPPAG